MKIHTNVKVEYQLSQVALRLLMEKYPHATSDDIARLMEAQCENGRVLVTLKPGVLGGLK